jgi:hypothetical protein
MRAGTVSCRQCYLLYADEMGCEDGYDVPLEMVSDDMVERFSSSIDVLSAPPSAALSRTACYAEGWVKRVAASLRMQCGPVRRYRLFFIVYFVVAVSTNKSCDKKSFTEMLEELGTTSAGCVDDGSDVLSWSAVIVGAFPSPLRDAVTLPLEKDRHPPAAAVVALCCYTPQRCRL